MSLTADPPACSIAASGGQSSHALNNAGAERLAFKVKSSNNTEYRITPVFGFVEPNGKTELKITRTAGAPKEDKAVVHFAIVPPDATDATTAFNSAQPSGAITIPLSSA